MLVLFSFSIVALFPTFHGLLLQMAETGVGRQLRGWFTGLGGLMMLLGWIGGIWFAATDTRVGPLPRPLLISLLVVGNVLAAFLCYWLSVRPSHAGLTQEV